MKSQMGGGGKMYRAILGGGGGETYYRVPPPKPLLEASEFKVGFVWSVLVSAKENNMA